MQTPRVGEFETVAMHLVGPREPDDETDPPSYEFHLKRRCGLCPKNFEHVSKLVEDIYGKQNKMKFKTLHKS